MDIHRETIIPCHYHVAGYKNVYCYNPKYWDRQALQTLYLDQTPHNLASDQGLHCLPYIQQNCTYING